MSSSSSARLIKAESEVLLGHKSDWGDRWQDAEGHILKVHTQHNINERLKDAFVRIWKCQAVTLIRAAQRNLEGTFIKYSIWNDLSASVCSKGINQQWLIPCPDSEARPSTALYKNPSCSAGTPTKGDEIALLDVGMQKLSSYLLHKGEFSRQRMLVHSKTRCAETDNSSNKRIPSNTRLPRPYNHSLWEFYSRSASVIQLAFKAESSDVLFRFILAHGGEGVGYGLAAF